MTHLSLERPATAAATESNLSVGDAVARLAHLLPSQGPITVFVHHNTLHAFERLTFAEAVVQAADLFDRHPYLPEEDYRAELNRGRIRPQDLSHELIDELDEVGDELIGSLGTRHELWLSMLGSPLREGPDAEIHWFIDETEALYRFRPEASAAACANSVQQTRRWLVRDYAADAATEGRLREQTARLIKQFGPQDVESWSARTWDAFTLHLLWQICRDGVAMNSGSAKRPKPIPAKDRRAQRLVDAELIRLCGAFLDQGFAVWDLPERERGLFASYLDLRGDGPADAPWMVGLAEELAEIRRLGLGPEQCLERALAAVAVDDTQRETTLRDALLALPGWAGMLWQMETNAEWTVRPAPPGTLLEYAAIRLLLTKFAEKFLARADAADSPPAEPKLAGRSPLLQAFRVFQIAQVRGWTPVDLLRLRPAEWRRLLREVEAFSSRERRRIYHQAYERRLREEVLGAICENARAIARPTSPAALPAFQLVACIDDREESFRRHLEEVAPECETFGYAGFFGVAMYYRGVSEAHFRPLCPVNVKPRHYLQEKPALSAEEASRRQARARRTIGRVIHAANLGARTLLGGAVASLMGAAATLPLVLRVVAPRTAGQFQKLFGRIVVPGRTQLTIERTHPLPGSGVDQLGYHVDEMAAIVEGTLRAIGLVERFAPLVIVAGHGSSSLNNPHAAAYDCGACGGGRGGPNARAFAQMANDPRLRAALAARGLKVPESTWFLGAYHNTGDDGIEYYDLDELPATRRAAFQTARDAIEEARTRNAHERCRRFESASLSLSPAAALRHVEGRAADLSQVRIECGHATNAYCLVGRRAWSRGLFLDRRAFLASYDPRIDDEEGSILARVLAAVIPVCGGINLEYYFSRIDNNGYGCGTKLPHNITSMLGVMDGAGSDLRTGLPWQMVEIHEPVRILFVVETTPETLERIIASNAELAALVGREWVQLAAFDPQSRAMHLHRRGRFEPHAVSAATLPVVDSSAAWYRGQRDHLGFARVAPTGVPGDGAGEGGAP